MKLGLSPHIGSQNDIRLTIITLTDRLEPDLKFCLARRTRSGASPQADEESIERVLGHLKPVQLESSTDRQGVSVLRGEAQGG